MENENTNATISAAELRESLNKNPDQFFLIDVLTPEEFASRHVPGAINIPINEFENHLSEIPKDKSVIVVCKMGLLKSDKALEHLHNNGYVNVRKLEGGNAAWFS